MRLYILGKNKKDKGDQLEILTKDILIEQGYKNITKSLIGIGGEEIDVYAEKEVERNRKKKKHIIMCECKAHEKVINLTDYLKFKGKIVTEKEKNKNVTGLLVALSGAAGTVIGANNETKSDIQLIANDDIIKLISHIYELEDTFNIRQYVKSLTERIITDIDVAYYEHAIYWIISFTGGEYYIIKNKAENNQFSDLSVICSLVENSSPLSKYIDIEHERKAFIRETYYRSTILAQLMESAYSIDELLSRINNHKHEEYTPLSIREFKKILNDCQFITCERDKIALLPEKGINYISFYKYILVGSVNVSILSQPYYLRHINKQLLDEIIKIQHFIQISNDKVDDIIFMLQNSPSALTYAIYEDKSITRYRGIDGKTLSENINEVHTQMFMEKVIDRFENDYCSNSALHDYYLNICKINNVIKKKEITINCADNKVRHLSQEQDIMLCELKDYNTIVATRKLPE